MSNDVPLLTADQARWLTIHRSVAAQHDVDAIQDSVVAIATGRAVVVPRMSEDEAREKYEAKYDVMPSPATMHGQTGRYIADCATEWSQGLNIYVQALRDIGVIRPDEKEGV